jgi:hypothetical protein
MQMQDVKARDVSLAAKIIALGVILAGTALVGLDMLHITVYEVTWAAFAIVAVFGTVDINIMLEKFKK